MKTVTLSAQVVGEAIQLDEPFEFPPGARLLVTVLPIVPVDHDQGDWYALARAGLARAYEDDEPDYPASLIRKQSPR